MPFTLRKSLLSFFSFSVTTSQENPPGNRNEGEKTARDVSSHIKPPPIFTHHPLDKNDYPQLTTNRQKVLLLHGPRQEYALTEDHAIHMPNLDHELLVKILVVGLNPIDWKAPAYNFGLPAFPLIAGRDFAGIVVRGPRTKSRIKPGDVILCTSTDYRDFRKSAFQEFAIATDFNVCRLPKSFPQTNGPPLGVAFVAAALALGVCLGVDFSTIEGGGNPAGPDLLKIVRSTSKDSVPPDVVQECFNGIAEDERPVPGDWIAIWGGSTSTGFLALQLAKLAGLKVICVVDVAKHGDRLLRHGVDVLVDRFDPERAVSIISGVTKTNKLRFALDAIGKETATLLQNSLASSSPETVEQQAPHRSLKSHLVGLTGLPKREDNAAHVTLHSVPIKLFHSVPAVGESLMSWLETILLDGRLSPPEIDVASGGLGGVNKALDALRRGDVSGQRVVVPL